jgi:hypothetical protein
VKAPRRISLVFAHGALRARPDDGVTRESAARVDVCGCCGARVCECRGPSCEARLENYHMGECGACEIHHVGNDPTLTCGASHTAPGDAGQEEV